MTLTLKALFKSILGNLHLEYGKELKVSSIEHKDSSTIIVLLPKGLMRIDLKFTSFKEDQEGR